MRKRKRIHAEDCICSKCSQKKNKKIGKRFYYLLLAGMCAIILI